MRLIYIVPLFVLLSSCLQDEELNMPFRSFAPLEMNDGLILSSPEAEGMDAAALTRVYEGIYTHEDLWPLRSMLVFRNGRLVAESYLKDERHISQPQLIWSCTKQVMGILTGLALEEGFISSLDDPISMYLPGISDDHPEKAGINIRHLITMQSGIDYNNDGVGGETDKVLRQIPDDLTSFILTRPMRDDPGSSFWYNDGDPQLMAAIIQEASGAATDLWADDVLFSRIGLTNYHWTRYKDGTTLGGYGLETTPRGMARIALCVADSGRYNGQQVIPRDWISQMTSPQVETGNEYDFGYFWWLDQKRNIQFMWGHGGQFAFVIPQESLLVVMSSIPNTQGGYQVLADEALIVVDQLIAACLN